jgi:hypothetical protein
MTDCERLRADAPGLAALPPDDPERAAAFAHAEGCPGCTRALHEAERLQAVLAAFAPPARRGGARAPEPWAATSPEADLAQAPVLRALEAELVHERRRRSAWAGLAAAAATVALVALARHRGGSGLDWTLAGLLAVAGAALAALAARLPWGALAGAAVAAGAAVVCAGHAGPAEVGTGVHCLLTELACAGVVLAAGWLALRGGTTRPARVALAAAAAAGALAGAAGLQVACSAHEIGLHLLAFHAGGVVLAAGLAALLPSLYRRRAGEAA